MGCNDDECRRAAPELHTVFNLCSKNGVEGLSTLPALALSRQAIFGEPGAKRAVQSISPRPSQASILPCKGILCVLYDYTGFCLILCKDFIAAESFWRKKLPKTLCKEVLSGVPEEITASRTPGKDYLNWKFARWKVPSTSWTTSWRQVPDQALSVFQT